MSKSSLTRNLVLVAEYWMKKLINMYFVFWLCISYILEFDDDEEDGSLPQRSVPFHKVVALPEGHGQ